MLSSFFILQNKIHLYFTFNIYVKYEILSKLTSFIESRFGRCPKYAEPLRIFIDNKNPNTYNAYKLNMYYIDRRME